MGDARGLRVIEQGSPPAKYRHQGHGEHDHAHATLPMGKTSPKQDTLGQRLHIVQDRGTGRRITRHAFEPGVNQAEFTAPKHIRHHSGHAGCQPRSHHDPITLLGTDLLAFRYENQRENTQHRCQQKTQQQRIETRIEIVEQRNTRRQQHEPRIQQEHQPHISQHYVQPHNLPPRYSLFLFFNRPIRASIYSLSLCTSSRPSIVILNGILELR